LGAVQLEKDKNTDSICFSFVFASVKTRHVVPYLNTSDTMLFLFSRSFCVCCWDSYTGMPGRNSILTTEFCVNIISCYLFSAFNEGKT
jgi:hypothetical protein